MNSWPTKKLGEVAQLRMGETLIRKDLTGDGVPVYSADSLEKPWGYTSKNKLKFRRGAIVIGARGTIGSLKLPEDNYFTSTQTTIVVEPNIKEILPEFLFYFLNTLNFRKGGTGIPMITIGYLKTIKIPTFPLNIQQKIVERLDAIKKVQELNDKQIELAEELFQSLLHRELKSKIKNQKLKLQFKIKKLREVITINYGKGLAKSERKENGRYFAYGSNGPVYKTNKILVNNPTIIIGRKGAVGALYLTKEPSWPIDTTFYVEIKDKDELDLDFLYFLLQTMNLQYLAIVTAVPGINRDNLYNLKIPLPPLETQKKIVEKLSAVQEYKKKLLDQKQKLQELFDSVLNKSFKGESLE